MNPIGYGPPAGGYLLCVYCARGAYSGHDTERDANGVPYQILGGTMGAVFSTDEGPHGGCDACGEEIE